MRIWFWLRAALVPLAALAAIAFFVNAAVSKPTALHISDAVIAVSFGTFVLLADLATFSRTWLQNGCVMLATLCLGIGGLETYASAASRKSDVGPKGPGLFTDDPVLGARQRSGTFPSTLVIGGKTIYDVVYTVDAKQRRYTKPNPGGPRVVFFGDSWTFGQGVKDSDTLPQAFADRTGADVLNYGIEGGSPAQTLRAMEVGLFDKDITGARLFVLQTAPFHVGRTACRYVWVNGAPHYRIINDKAAFVGACKAHWWQQTGTWKLLFEPFDEQINGDQVETYLEIVDRIAVLAREKYHTALLIVDDAWLQPYLNQSRVGFTKKDVEARFKATGAMVIDNETEVKNPSLLELPVDFHPTPLANRLIAKKIAATIAAEQPKLLERTSVADTAQPGVSRSAEAVGHDPEP